MLAGRIRGFRRRRALVVVLAVLVSATGLAACGGDDAEAPSPVAADVDAPPALAGRAAGAGEIVVTGAASPAEHGPYALRGTYLARFAQGDPTDPSVDFTAQTSFVARLVPVDGGPSVRLFRTAAASASTTVRADGRYRVVVEFGDFPYAIRLTPSS